MSGLLKTTVLILGLLLAAVAVVSLTLAWTGRPTVPSGQTASETPVTGPSRERQVPVDHGPSAGTRTATFALGWFWGPDSQFGSLPGVIRTRVGYAGGATPDPTYHNLGSHSETVQIDYDPEQISYQELLDRFWNSHSPTRRPWSSQYASIIFYHDQEQKRLAEQSRDRFATEIGDQVFTQIVPFSEFYLAETYHQKYRLQQASDLLEEFRAIYPDDQAFIDSTAAARFNGYMGGYSTVAALEAEIRGLDLPAETQERLLVLVSGLER